MTRVWKIIAMALSSAYLLQTLSCYPPNTGNGLSFIPNIPGGASITQTIQQLLGT